MKMKICRRFVMKCINLHYRGIKLPVSLEQSSSYCEPNEIVYTYICICMSKHDYVFSLKFPNFLNTKFSKIASKISK